MDKEEFKQEIRLTALVQAIDSYKGQSTISEDIVDRARVFEEYILNGKTK